MYPSERTPLASSQPGPPYVFVANPHREYRKQIKQFQCCVCTTILGIFLSALIVTIIYSVDSDVIDAIPKPTLPTPTPAPTNSSLQTLMGLDFPLRDEVSPDWNGTVPDDEQLQSAVQKGKEAVAKKTEIEKNMPLMVKDSPTYRYRQATKTSEEATKLAEYGHVMEEVTKQFSPISGNSPGRGPRVSSSVLDNPACSVENLDTCEVSRYRTINGSCNNLNQTWGVAMKPFRRVLSPHYADGVSVPRVSSDLSPLPSAREVSVMIHRPEYRDDPKFTVMLAVWGQFLDHDLTATALSQGQDGEPITCCSETPATAHPECMPVRITPDDPKFKDSGTDCLDFVRSAPAPSCTLGPREQLNQASSFLDGSVVYGSDDELAKKLRRFRGGKMRVSHGKDGKVLLPVSTDPNDGCNEEEENKKGRYCFMAGDARSNENLHLTTMHLLFVRQHNLIAEQLAAMNPDWDDEKIYQEARHIVVAQMQHITYNEFLPIVLGPQLMAHLHLHPQANGYWDGYNETTDPTIANNFAASSFRFAHTLLPGLMKVAAQYSDSYEAIELHKMLFNPYKLYAAGYVAKAIQGALVTHLERADTYFTPELTQHLFEKDGDNATLKEKKKPVCGLDLVSLNIQRGRDHGLPTYPAWREHCGFKRPKSFEDLQGAMDEESLKEISSIYKSVDDVDLYTGSLSEVPIEGGLLGPTATCLLADQFKRLKDGDRYWYETSESPQKFSPGQLEEIRKTTLAGIICATSDGVKESQHLVMQSVSPSNERVPCSQIPQTNLDAWRPWHWQKVNITLVGGKIHVKEHGVDEVMAWDGLLPVALPLPADIGSETSETAEDVTLKVSGGIQWFSNLLIVDGDVIRANGSFSAPYYAKSSDDSRRKTHWINGDFDLKFRADSNFDWSVVPGQLIYSPVYYKVTQEMKVPLPELEVSAKKFVLQSPPKKFILQNSPSVSKENFVLQSSPALSREKVILQQSPKEVKAPIFLEGIFSGDRTKFFWDGEGFVLLPSTRPRQAEDGSSSTMNDQPKNDLESEEDDNEFDRDWVIVPKSNPKKRQISSNEKIDEDQSDLPSDDGVSLNDQSNTIANPKDDSEQASVVGEHVRLNKKPSFDVKKGPMQRFLQAAPYEDSRDAARPQNRHTVNITLVGGEIKTKGDGVDEVMVWDGTLPVAVPLPANIGSEINNDYVEDVGLKVNSGIQWFSSSLRVDGDTIRVNGSFSAPDDENSYDDSENKAHWINGKFNLKFHAESDINWEGVPGQLISSPVYFKVTKEMKVPLPELEVSAKTFVLPTALKRSSHPENSPTNLKKKLLLLNAPTSSREKFILQQSLKEMKAPIFLEGTFSEDRTKFYWDGEGTVLLPTIGSSRTEDRAAGTMNEPKMDDDSKEDDFGFNHDWSFAPKDYQKRRDSILDGQIDRDQSDVPSGDEDSQNDQSNSIADSKDGWEQVSVTGKHSSLNKKPSTGTKKGPMRKFQLQSGPDKDNCTFKFDSIPGHHMNESEADSEWELVPGTVCDYRRKGSGHLGPKDPPANKNVIDDIIDARKEGRLPTREPITFDASGHQSDDFIEGMFRLSELPKKSTMQKFQLQASPDKDNCTFKFESIPGHHVNVSEADSEWELVPGTVCDYRRKGSGHLGPKDPPRNKNVIDDIIESRKEGKIHKKDPIQFDGASHHTDNFVKFQLKALPAKESNESSAPEKKNRVLIKVDPSISLFPSDWKYDNSSGSRMIPVDYFYKVNTANRTSKPVILWSAKLIANMLQGNISIPEFVLDANSSKRVLWQNTTFSLNFQSAAENVLQLFATGGMLHNSRIVLKDLKCSNVENVSNDFETLNWQLDTFQKISLIQSGNSLPTSDILLLGEFTENKTSFEWNGSLMINFANEEKEDDFEVAMKDVNSEWSAIPLKVTSVTFNVDSVNGKPAPKAWSSLTPNSFPLAVLANNHITDVNSALLWTGRVEGDKLKGNYTLPIFQQSKISPHVLKGSFEMRLRANLPQVSWSNLYSLGGKPPGHPNDPKNPKGPRMIMVPFIDSWPPPPSHYPQTFPIPFPLNISSSPSDPAVKTKLEGTKDNIDTHSAKDSGKSPSLLHWSPGKVLSQADSSEVIAPSRAQPHLLQNTIPWPPSYPKWPKDKPAPWEEPYPFADSNAEPHPDEPALAKNMDIEEKKAHVKLNSKATQTDFSSADMEAKPHEKVMKSKVEEKRSGMLHAAPSIAKHSNSDDVEKLTALYMKKLATVVRPGVQYATKLLPKSRDGVKYDTKKLNVPQDIANMLKNSVPSKMVIDGAWKENSDYYWPGNAVFIAPLPKPTLKKLGDPIGTLPYYKGNYAAKIVDGSLSAGLEVAGPSTLWSGKMPANIELPVSWASANVSVEGSSFVKGIHWTPTLVSYDRVEGTYYLDGEDTTNSSSRFAGNFQFELLPLWSDTTINKLLIPGRKYYSKVVFEQLPDWMKYASAPWEVDDEPIDPDEEKTAPLTIRGDFNADKTAFEWGGNAVIKIT